MLSSSHVRSLVTDDVTYVSLNYDNPDLRSIMPWCGTHDHAGPESIVKSSGVAISASSERPTRVCQRNAGVLPPAVHVLPECFVRERGRCLPHGFLGPRDQAAPGLQPGAGDL
jgi:hypothetical protein